MRKTTVVQIPADPPGTPPERANRDAGKLFQITEMPSHQWHFWLLRVAQAVGRSGLEMPATMSEVDPILLSRIALRSLGMMPYEEMRSLIGELVGCVKIIRNPSNMSLAQDLIGEYGDQDVEESGTLLLLESEVIKLHTGFSIAEALSTQTSAPTTSPGSSAPQTSQGSTPSPSAAA